MINKEPFIRVNNWGKISFNYSIIIPKINQILKVL